MTDAIEAVMSVLDPNPASVEAILAPVALKRTEPARPNFTDPDHYRRVTHIAFTPTSYGEMMDTLDRLRDADDDDDRAKYGTGFSA